MTHVRPGDKAARVKASCRRGVHVYGEAQHIGAGIMRRVCTRCSAVTIDLTDAEWSSVPAGDIAVALDDISR